MDTLLPFRLRLARLMRTARRRAQLTQDGLAERIGCSVRTVQRAEKGTSTPADEVITEWERVCGVRLLADSPRAET